MICSVSAELMMREMICKKWGMESKRGWSGFRCGDKRCRGWFKVIRNSDGAVIVETTEKRTPRPAYGLEVPGSAVGKLFGVYSPPAAVAAVAQAAPPKKHAANDDIMKVVALRRAGMSYRKIEAAMGWPKGNGSRAFAIVKKHGGVK